MLLKVGRWDNAKFQSIIDALDKVSEEGIIHLFFSRRTVEVMLLWFRRYGIVTE